MGKCKGERVTGDDVQEWAGEVTWSLMGENVKVTILKGDLFLRVGLKHRGNPSASGKTIRVASTCGNIMVPGTDGIVLGLNAYVKP